MTEERREYRRRGRFGLWLLLSLALVLGGAGLGVMALTGRPLNAPGWVVSGVEGRVNRLLAGKASVSLGGVELVVGGDFIPHVRLTELHVRDSRGDRVASLPDLRVSLSLDALLAGRLQPVRIRISGASLALRRARSGQLDVALGGSIVPAQVKMTSIDALMGAVDRIMATPLMAGLKRVEANALTLTLDDKRAGRVWQVSDGRLTLVQGADTVSIELGFGLAGSAGGQPARAVMTFVTRKDSPQSRLSVRVRGVSARDIAAQAPALAWLKLVRAPISGEFRAALDEKGRIGTLEGALDFGAGAVRPGAATAPIPFDSGKLAFRYDPATRKVEFTRASVRSKVLRVSATGHAYLRDMSGGLPKTLLAQVRFSRVMVDPQGLFSAPVRFSQGAVDLRLRLDPFDLTLGQLVLVEGKRKIVTRGELRATDAGWHVALDSDLNQISHRALLALWPVDVVPKTRDWLKENVQTGLLFNFRTALRIQPGQKARIALSYDFSGADVRFIKTLPPIQKGRGYATITDHTYTMVVDSGYVAAPKGGNVDVSGSVFSVPDITRKPTPAVVDLKTDSSITAALSLLDQPPFRFLSKAGRSVDLAQGRARLNARISLPLEDHIPLSAVTFDVSGTLEGVRSDKLMRGRTITATSLQLKADNAALTISGRGRLGVLPFDMTWRQALGPDKGRTSTITGQVALSQAFVDEFHIGLPPGAVSGDGQGRIDMTLDRGGGGTFRLRSDLAGVGLSIPEIGWSKPAAQKGLLEIDGRLGRPASIDRLVIQGNGLDATGAVSLGADGRLARAHFSRVRIGGWLDAPVDLVGRDAGGGRRGIAISVGAGTIDLRHARFGRSRAQREALPIRLALKDLIVSEGIRLAGFQGSFSTLGGLNGNFIASVNGKAPIAGTVAPSANGPAVRVQAQDAGRVLAAAGLFDRGRGGRFELTLVPRPATGNYAGHLSIRDIKVVRAPALADLLEAISIVGLIEQLNGPGIAFTDVEADFRLTPRALEVSKGSAIGPSMGLSLAGLYDLGNRRFDMQGVISPIYILNGIGSILTGKGEGLFGFNYTLKGTADKPHVSVNPLSILTPGMFRNLFRGPPPKLPPARAPGTGAASGAATGNGK